VFPFRFACYKLRHEFLHIATIILHFTELILFIVIGLRADITPSEWG
jgi:hypothetical protein